MFLFRCCVNTPQLPDGPEGDRGPAARASGGAAAQAQQEGVVADWSFDAPPEGPVLPFGLSHPIDRSPGAPITFGSVHGLSESAVARGDLHVAYLGRLTTPGKDILDDIIFKPLLGIRENELQMAASLALCSSHEMRNNLAMCDLAQRLNFDVVPQTWPAVDWSPGKQPVLGIAMSRAIGVPARDAGELLRHPEAMRHAVQMQLLDFIMGEQGRHSRNYFVGHGEDGTLHLTAIDNDGCAHPELRASNHMFKLSAIDLPPVVDSQMAHSILNLTPQELAVMLEKRAVPQGEIDSALRRLERLQAHIRQLEGRPGGVIGPGDWREPWEVHHVWNSHIARELHYQNPNAVFIPLQMDVASAVAVEVPYAV